MTIKKSVLATVIGAFTLIGAQSAIAEVLRMGVEGAYPPFSQKEANGTLSGFDIDIALAICAELERECELVEHDGGVQFLFLR